MDELSMLFVLSSFSVILFVSICFFAYYNKGRQDFRLIILGSGSYTIALILFYYDVKFLLTGSPNATITFFTCIFVYLGVTLFVRSLTKVYEIKSIFSKWICTIFIIVSSLLIAYSTLLGEYLIRAILFYIALCIPLVVALIYQHKSKTAAKINLVSTQIYIIFIIVLLDSIFYFTYDGVLDFSNPPLFSKVFLMLSNIVVVTLFFSFIIERNGMDIKELRDKRELLETMFHKVKVESETDQLTQIFNRRKIDSLLNSLYSNYQINKTPYSVMLIDIDHFKMINDTYSHQIGDQVLKYISLTLGSLTRTTDFLGRFGGDEFIIVLSNTTYEQCLLVKDKIQQDKIVFTKGDLSLTIGLSIGCSEIELNQSNEDLIHVADINLYTDKKK